MSESSLAALGAAFEKWRKNKRNAREPIPKALWEETLRAVEISGALSVSRVTKLQRSRIVERAEKEKSGAMSVPGFSRVSITAPSVPRSPVAEMETAAGVTLRIFVQTPEMFKLLSTLCSPGVAQ